MSLPTDGIKDGHKVNSHLAKLQELWKTPQIQTIHISKSMTDTSFLKVCCQPTNTLFKYQYSLYSELNFLLIIYIEVKALQKTMCTQHIV